ncbi:DNA mismatch repair protein Msh2-like isoform X2 [Gordionus sp. m RMFG-2023]|uniref:DNA mismatch repair protein Msh2-like isoform X2 n=1 Tax=Gordionus sp. m RMFG-2023 TaxID=3053472 RepID=UPI0031FD449E
MTLQPNQSFNIDATQERGFITFFNMLTEKPNTTIRIFDRGEYYTVHGNDAIYTSKEVFKTTGVLKYNGKNQKLPYVVLSKLNFESFARDLLLVKKYRIEIFKGNVNKNDWTLSIKASPGNLWQIEDILFGNFDLNTTSGIMSVKLRSDVQQQNYIGVAYYEDFESLKFNITEFYDDEQLSTFEALIVHLGPKECLLPTKSKDNSLLDLSDKLTEILERNKVLITERKKNDFTTQDVVQDMNKLLKFKNNQSSNFSSYPEYQNSQLALSCTSAIIKYLDLLSQDCHYGVYSLDTLNVENFMKLDMAAIKALNLFPEHSDMNSETNKHRPQNLYALLNKCRTSQGQRLLHRWIKQPLLDDVYRIYKAVKWLPNIVTSLDSDIESDHKDNHSNNCSTTSILTSHFSVRIGEIFNDFTKYIEMCELMIDLERIENNQEYLIKPEFDEDLKCLRESLNQLENSMQAQFKSVAKDLSLEQGKGIKLEYSSPIGHYYRITKKDEKCLRNNKKYTTIDTNNNGVRFKDSKLDTLNLSYMQTKADYEEHQKIVVDEIMNIASGYTDPLMKLTEITAELDVLISFADVSQNTASQPYVRPIVLPKEERIIDIKQARNPCMEIQDDMSFIPNDIYFKKGETTFYIITGPNMGGKSTYIRTAGTLILMAQIGCFIPCNGSHGDIPKLSILDGILCRVGSSDSQTRGVSTFMAEMIETTAILKQATEHSLIIIDELGRGTSTYDGFGLAWAISEHIALNIGCFTFFATHFHELTQLAQEIATRLENKMKLSNISSNSPHDNILDVTNCMNKEIEVKSYSNNNFDIVKNLHVTALIVGSDIKNGMDIEINDKGLDCLGREDKNLVLLYKVKRGVCDRSFGIHIAKMAKFPESVIKMAKEKADELGDCSYDDYYTDINENENNFYKNKKEGLIIIKEFLKKVQMTLNKCEDFPSYDSKVHIRDKILDDLKTQFLNQNINNSYIKMLINKLH